MMHTSKHTSRGRTVRVRTRGAALILSATLSALSVATSGAVAVPRTLPACATDEGPDGQANRGCVWDARAEGNGQGRSFVIRRDKDSEYGTLVYVTHARAHFLLTGVAL